MEINPISPCVLTIATNATTRITLERRKRKRVNPRQQHRRTQRATDFPKVHTCTWKCVLNYMLTKYTCSYLVHIPYFLNFFPHYTCER